MPMADRKNRLISKEECEGRKWPHNNRCRYTHGFKCEDCGTFFPIESIGYKRHEYPSTLWMAIWNYRAGITRKGGHVDEKEIEELIARCDGLIKLPDESLLHWIAEIEKWLRQHRILSAHKATNVELKV